MAARDETEPMEVDDRIPESEHKAAIEEKDREISKLRQMLTEAQETIALRDQQILGANMAELRGRRLADAGYDVLIQTASENAQALGRVQRAAQEAQHEDG